MSTKMTACALSGVAAGGITANTSGFFAANTKDQGKIGIPMRDFNRVMCQG